MWTWVLWVLLVYLVIQHIRNRKYHSKLKDRIFYGYIIISLLVLTNILKIPWTKDADMNLFLTFSIIWLSYIPIVLKLAHKEINRTHPSIHRARQHLGSHVRHLSDNELHSHLKHKV